jgi:5-methylcytosine-specific restriction endonuclease McrA
MDPALNACGGHERLYHVPDTDCTAYGRRWTDHSGTPEKALDCTAAGVWQCDGTDDVVCFSKGNGDGETCDGEDNDCDGKIDEGEDGEADSSICSFGF